MTLVPKRIRQLSQRSDETHCLLPDTVNASLKWVPKMLSSNLKLFPPGRVRLFKVGNPCQVVSVAPPPKKRGFGVTETQGLWQVSVVTGFEFRLSQGFSLVSKCPC